MSDALSIIIPKHVAIIMDGNGKWAKKRFLPKIMGHRKGAEVAKEISLACKSRGIDYLTLYVFSTENWSRPKEEVTGVMDILRDYLKNHVIELTKQDTRIIFIGNLDMLAPDVKEMAENVAEMTKHNKFTLVFALSYGSRDEMQLAAVNFAKDVAAGKIVPENENFANYLYTKSIPDPDLLIRTGGEYRLSNFLLYQLSYTELYFTDTLWPDFTEKDLDKALDEYTRRERRFGKRLDEAV